MKDKRIEKFRKLADNMQGNIDNKLCPATASQNLTPKRVRTMESMFKDGEKLEKIQAILRGVADDLEKGLEPAIDVNSKKDIERELSKNPDGYGISLYLTPPSDEEIQVRELRKIEMELVGMKIPGFFPTPEYVIRMMMDKIVCDIENPVFLETSAGKGNIVEYIRKVYSKACICSYEVNNQLVKILRLKGIEVNECDFLEDIPDKPFADFIILNPPFEKFADIKHVRHAYDNFLKPGGRLVSIMSEGVFFRSNKVCDHFRKFLENRGYSEKLDAGSFKSAFRQTGVNCRIVVLDKGRYV